MRRRVDIAHFTTYSFFLKLPCVYADEQSMSHLKIRGGWSHCFVCRVMTVYNVVLHRLYVCRLVRWLIFGNILRWSPFRVSTSGDLARLNQVLLTMACRQWVALSRDLYELWYQILCSVLLSVYH